MIIGQGLEGLLRRAASCCQLASSCPSMTSPSLSRGSFFKTLTREKKLLASDAEISVSLCLATSRPVPLSIGYAAQYVLKPLLGVLIARAFRVPSPFFAGFILTCCVSGAQLSSYASFLSKGDVALSILLTSCSTISSVVVTPVLTGLLIGSVVPVDGAAMAKSILQVAK
jgi:bile acid:Na+ symporter, BASS family